MQMTNKNQKKIREVNITLPANRDEVESLELGDAVFLNGLVFTGREGFYHRIFEKGIEPTIDIRTLGGAKIGRASCRERV